MGYLYFLFSGPVLCSLFFTAMVSFSVRYYIRHAFLAAVRSYPAPHEHVPHFPKESTAAHSWRCWAWSTMRAMVFSITRFSCPRPVPISCSKLFVNLQKALWTRFQDWGCVVLPGVEFLLKTTSLMDSNQSSLCRLVILHFLNCIVLNLFACSFNVCRNNAAVLFIRRWVVICDAWSCCSRFWQDRRGMLGKGHLGIQSGTRVGHCQQDGSDSGEKDHFWSKVRSVLLSRSATSVGSLKLSSSWRLASWGAFTESKFSIYPAINV